MLDAVKRDGDPVTRDDDADGGDDRTIHCRACGHRLTTERARMDMSGAHEHTFVNPHGHVFQVGCFSRAPGVVWHGRPSNEFSWFPGYAWRVGICGECLTHLGWGFGDGPAFVALIADRVVPGDDAS